MNELALFAGAGGGILGGHLLGWKTVAACEIEDYPRETLLRRQLDGLLPRFPIWDDIRTFDGKQFRGKVDIITGGFPCQDISAAGDGAGITGERSGLWGEMARIIDEIRPRFAFMENSPMLTTRGLGTVLRGLAEMGYNARWCVLGGYDIGGPIQRNRIWILAYNASPDKIIRVNTKPSMHNKDAKKKQFWSNSAFTALLDDAKSRVPIITGDERMVDDVGYRMDRFRAVGNGQIPAVAAIAFLKLSEDLI